MSQPCVSNFSYHSKRTAFGVSRKYPALVRPRQFMTKNVAQSLCAQLTADVFSAVPRLEDYTCPVCMSLAWLPVRLNCQHVFCVRCVVKMQREFKKQCPLCRKEVVMKADLSEHLPLEPSDFHTHTQRR
jgi:E3 ubiquitin-protein ligase BAH